MMHAASVGTARSIAILAVDAAAAADVSSFALHSLYLSGYLWPGPTDCCSGA